jgi:uncharacterized protein YndB with AHSA1/START domain
MRRHELERIEQTREAAAPVETCWDVLTDPARGAEWLAFADEVRTEGEPGVGQVLIAKGSLLGASVHARSEVHRYDPLESFGWTGEQPFPTRVEVELTAVDDGTTELATSFEADPGRFFPVGKRMAMRKIRGQFSRSADRLVELIEAEAGH